MCSKQYICILCNELIKLTTGVNFTNFLWAALAHANPKSTKKTVQLSVFFALSGSACIRPAHRMLMKLTPGFDFINILLTALTLVDPKSIKRYWQLDWVLMLTGSTSAKAVHRTLMMLTPSRHLSPQNNWKNHAIPFTSVVVVVAEAHAFTKFVYQV